ncbi:hypothetical protein ABIA85_009376 [Bradyrhizobium sp. LA6.10]
MRLTSYVRKRLTSLENPAKRPPANPLMHIPVANVSPTFADTVKDALTRILQNNALP